MNTLNTHFFLRVRSSTQTHTDKHISDRALPFFFHQTASCDVSSNRLPRCKQSHSGSMTSCYKIKTEQRNVEAVDVYLPKYISMTSCYWLYYLLGSGCDISFLTADCLIINLFLDSLQSPFKEAAAHLSLNYSCSIARAAHICKCSHSFRSGSYLRVNGIKINTLLSLVDFDSVCPQILQLTFKYYYLLVLAK